MMAVQRGYADLANPMQDSLDLYMQWNGIVWNRNRIHMLIWQELSTI